MAFTQAANIAEKIVGHGDNASITTDVSNYNNEYGMETGGKILATTWQGKKSVKLGNYFVPIFTSHKLIILKWKCRSLVSWTLEM